MNISFRSASLAALIALSLTSGAQAFESGSTGSDGAFNPTVSTVVQLPPNGVLNYTSVNIPSGVIVTFAKNATNTPVVMLVSGDANIAGAIRLNGTAGAATGAAGDGNIADDGMPGLGGPGGFDGGQGGALSSSMAGRESQGGMGPGGAGASRWASSGPRPCAGSGGGFGSSGGYPGHISWCLTPGHTTSGSSYGNSALRPLVGGSGGGGGAAGSILKGAGGGGGGGAILIAASGTITVTGSIRADGGDGGNATGAGQGGAGGAGSGGGIRLVATAIAGNGALSAQGGIGPTQDNGLSPVFSPAGNGGNGRIRLEAETLLRTAASTPAHSFSAPQPAFVAGIPTLRISSVAGVESPASPTGNADITLPESLVNPVALEVETSGVPLGTTVSIAIHPSIGDAAVFVTDALSGTEAAATATAQVNLPDGPSVILATVSYTLTEAVAMLSPYKELSGEDDLIERIVLQTAPDGTLRRTAVTNSGRELDLEAVASLWH